MRLRLALLVVAVVLASASIVAVGLLRANDEAEPGVPWDAYRSTSDGLQVFKLLRPCDEVTDVEVSESSSRVEVTLHVDSGGGCADLAVPVPSSVELTDALGARDVYDGACIDNDFASSLCLREPRQPLTHSVTH